MLIYQVTIMLQSARVAEWLDWMQQVHIPDVLRTGCFTRCTLARALDDAPAEATFVLRYDCPSKDIYERYLTEFAPALQHDHTTRFAGAFRGSRLVLDEVATLHHS